MSIKLCIVMYLRFPFFVDYNGGIVGAKPIVKEASKSLDCRGLHDADNPGLGPVSRKSRHFTGHFRVSQCLLYLKNREDLSRQTLQTCFF